MTRITITPSRRVTCRAILDLPVPAAVVWGRLRDFTTFASHDYFHAGIRIEGGLPRRGANLSITHRYLMASVERVGRILRWIEFEEETLRPAGYSFSDLSKRGSQHGFPHVFSYHLRPVGPAQSTLEITVRGIWTARLIPRWAARLWLWWVHAHIAVSVRNMLLMTAVTKGLKSRYAPHDMKTAGEGTGSTLEKVPPVPPLAEPDGNSWP